MCLHRRIEEGRCEITERRQVFDQRPLDQELHVGERRMHVMTHRERLPVTGPDDEGRVGRRQISSGPREVTAPNAVSAS